ncbi:MAG: cupin domain-containing protein [Prevotella sp.]
MNKIELQKTAEGFAVATVGSLATFEGKVFVKDVLATTGVEVSFGSLAPGEALPFFHHHKQNEELYVVISGEGSLILGKDEIAVASGSVIRIEPQVSRCVKAGDDAPLVYVCIQAKAGSLEQYTMTDGVIEQ